jgi:hypothetical protein
MDNSTGITSKGNFKKPNIPSSIINYIMVVGVFITIFLLIGLSIYKLNFNKEVLELLTVLVTGVIFKVL